jgi:hypothetical protein
MENIYIRSLKISIGIPQNTSNEKLKNTLDLQTFQERVEDLKKPENQRYKITDGVKFLS